MQKTNQTFTNNRTEAPQIAEQNYHKQPNKNISNHRKWATLISKDMALDQAFDYVDSVTKRDILRVDKVCMQKHWMVGFTIIETVTVLNATLFSIGVMAVTLCLR